MAAASLVVSGSAGGRARADAPDPETQAVWRMPDEAEPHRCTWMAFGPEAEVWGRGLLPRVREDLAALARTIARYEPVRMLVREADRALCADLCGESVRLMPLPLDDLWVRDTGPVFVKSQAGAIGGVGLNFNGWGNKQAHARDAAVARHVVRAAEADFVATELVGEGGGLEVDGHGTAIATESCWLNDNRNPGWTRAQIEAEFRRLFGIQHTVWLPGVRGADITDGHTDFYARFAGPGVVVAHLDNDPDSDDFRLTREHLRLLRNARDAHGRRFEVVTLEAPHRVRPAFETEEFCAGYVNFYVCNRGLIASQFGDPPRDHAARETLSRLFQGRTVEMLDTDGIAGGGGGVHCATQQQPA